MTKTSFALALLVPTLVFASESTNTNTNNVIDLRKLSREEARKAVLMFEGGTIGKPGTKQGKITYVNAQKRIPGEWLNESAKLFNGIFRNKIRYDIVITNGEFSLPSPKLESEATLFVIDDPSMPTILSAPENRWAMVNMQNLDEGRGAQEPFLHARALKRMMRGIALLAGAQDSTYPRCLLSCKTKAEDMDINPDCRLPVDVVKRFERYLVGYGIKPEKIVTYREAVEEGWAPQPSDEYQRVVWKEVHSIPKKPLQITFDPAAQKGKVTK